MQTIPIPDTHIFSVSDNPSHHVGISLSGCRKIVSTTNIRKYVHRYDSNCQASLQRWWYECPLTIAKTHLEVEITIKTGVTRSEKPRATVFEKSALKLKCHMGRSRPAEGDAEVESRGEACWAKTSCLGVDELLAQDRKSSRCAAIYCHDIIVVRK